jgi:4'-phosphopantetheinyl transferase
MVRRLRAKETLWRTPSKRLGLSDDEVHVWRVSVGAARPRIEFLLGALTRDEREKAGRFYFQKDRHRFVVARGALRDILSRYLNTPPGELRFSYGPQGKPRLEQCVRGKRLEFNLSHSHESIVVAVNAARQVGVDVERIRPCPDWDQIVERFFSPHEAAALRALPVRLRTEAFFCCWTRKEAYIKAKGGGLSIKLSGFDVSVTPGEPAKLLRSIEDPEAALRWSLMEIIPAPGYAGAVAVEGRDWRLRHWNWEKQE